MKVCADAQPAADASTPRHDTRHRAPHADHPLPAPGLAEVRLVSATPDAARQAAEGIHRVWRRGRRSRRTDTLNGRVHHAESG